ncbi:MAG: TVP38/TMEM64 family protein [Cytophagales bacterium]|nr:MAG: TVP38/TMEM64 family protein [Cytophagales bacterium]
MKKYFIVFSIVIVFFLTLFAIISLLDIPFLENPIANNYNTYFKAFISVSLLASDIVIPVPSSLLMISNGSVFGLVLGSLLSIFGSVMASMIGFYLGRKGERYLLRWTSESERLQGNKMIEKWGVFAVMLSRPIPLLAESVSIMAGVSPRISASKMLFISFVGIAPCSVLYAMVGAYAMAEGYTYLSFIIVILIVAAMWLLGNMVKSKPSS